MLRCSGCLDSSVSHGVEHDCVDISIVRINQSLSVFTCEVRVRRSNSQPCDFATLRIGSPHLFWSRVVYTSRKWGERTANLRSSSVFCSKALWRSRKSCVLMWIWVAMRNLDCGYLYCARQSLSGFTCQVWVRRNDTSVILCIGSTRFIWSRVVSDTSRKWVERTSSLLSRSVFRSKALRRSRKSGVVMWISVAIKKLK